MKSQTTRFPSSIISPIPMCLSLTTTSLWAGATLLAASGVRVFPLSVDDDRSFIESFSPVPPGWAALSFPTSCRPGPTLLMLGPFLLSVVDDGWDVASLIWIRLTALVSLSAGGLSGEPDASRKSACTASSLSFPRRFLGTAVCD